MISFEDGKKEDDLTLVDAELVKRMNVIAFFSRFQSIFIPLYIMHSVTPVDRMLFIHIAKENSNIDLLEGGNTEIECMRIEIGVQMREKCCFFTTFLPSFLQLRFIFPLSYRIESNRIEIFVFFSLSVRRSVVFVRILRFYNRLSVDVLFFFFCKFHWHSI